MTVPTLAKLAAEIYRDFNTAGVGASGNKKPYKPDIRAHQLSIETALNAAFSFGVPMFNGKLALSVAYNSLTISVLTAAGATPSAADPVYIAFRDPTETDGGFSIVAIIAALTLVVAAGSSLGAENAKAFRVWIVAINDNGTIRLGVQNSYSNAAGILKLFPLMEEEKQTATAEGTGAAVSAGVLYAPVTVGTARSIRFLGSAVWESGLAAAGTWGVAPTRVVQMGPGEKKPGDVVQKVRYATGATVSPGTTVTAYDNTIPQISEGNLMMSQAITPRSAANILEVAVRLNASYTVVAHLIAHLHQDAITDALNARAEYVGATNAMVALAFDHIMRSDLLVATTFTVRLGGSTAGTPRLNGASGAQLLGGAMMSSIEITERMM